MGAIQANVFSPDPLWGRITEEAEDAVRRELVGLPDHADPGGPIVQQGFQARPREGEQRVRVRGLS